MTKSISELDRAIGKVIAEFEIKQEIEFDDFVVDDPTGVAQFGDYYLDVSDIYHDLKTNQPKGRILAYFDFCMELHVENRRLRENCKEELIIPNYQNYCMVGRGLFIDWVLENKEDLEELKNMTEYLLKKNGKVTIEDFFNTVNYVPAKCIIEEVDDENEEFRPNIDCKLEVL